MGSLLHVRSRHGISAVVNLLFSVLGPLMLALLVQGQAYLHTTQHTHTHTHTYTYHLRTPMHIHLHKYIHMHTYTKHTRIKKKRTKTHMHTQAHTLLPAPPKTATHPSSHNNLGPAPLSPLLASPPPLFSSSSLPAVCDLVPSRLRPCSCPPCPSSAPPPSLQLRLWCNGS